MNNVTYSVCYHQFYRETSDLTYPHPAMIINPMGIFTVSVFLNRNKEKDRKPTKKQKPKTNILFIFKKQPINMKSKNSMM